MGGLAQRIGCVVDQQLRVLDRGPVAFGAVGVADVPDRLAVGLGLGRRIAALRKAQGLTQVQLAERLGASQQAMSPFEKGRRRVPVSLLPTIAGTLQTTLDALVGQEPAPAAAPKKRGPQKKIRQQLELIEALPLAKPRAIAQVLDSVLAAHQ